MKKRTVVLLLLPILIIMSGLLFFSGDVKTIANKINLFKDEPPVTIETINIEINDEIAIEFTDSVQAKTVNQHIQGYLTYDRDGYTVTGRVAYSTGEPVRASSYLESGIDYYFLFDIVPNEGYRIINDASVIINDETIAEEKINRHDGTITLLIDAPNIDLTDYGVEITPAPQFDNLIEGYNSAVTKTFSIKNTGFNTLNNISVTLSNNTVFDLDTSLLPSSLDSLQEGTVKITPKLGLTPDVYNSEVIITADRITNPVVKSLEVKILSRLDTLDLDMDDLSQYLSETYSEGTLNNLVYGSVSPTYSSPGYAIQSQNTKLTIFNGNTYSNINPEALIDLHKNYFYNVGVKADDSHGFANNVIVKVNNEMITNTTNKDETNYEMNSNKEITLHIKAVISTQGDDGVTIPILRRANLEYINMTSQYPDILFADPDLVSCTGSSQIFVGDYEITCSLTDPDNYYWKDGTNTPKTLEWSITPIQTTLLPLPSNVVKLPKGNSVDLNTQVENNSFNPLKCSANGLQTGISLEGCVVHSNFEAVENTTTWFTINVDGIDANMDGNFEYLPATNYTISVTTISNKPTNLGWDEDTATWDKIKGIGSYQVSLYDASDNQEVVTETVNTNADDFSDEIEDGKSYYFSVASITESGLGDISDPSPVFDTRQDHVLTHELVDQTTTYGDSFSYPISFTDNEGTRTYNSSNPQVASIDNNGNITINNVGQTEISLTAGAINSYRETTKSYILTVIPKKIAKPVYNKATSFSYNGKVIYLDYPTNYNENYMTISGTYGINPGNYKMIISLKDNSNYTWSDDSTKDIVYNWEIYKINTAVYKVSSSLNTSRVLEIKGASKANKANVQLNTSSNGVAQRFVIKYLKDGYYLIENVRSMKYFEIQGGKAVKGANIWQNGYTGSNAQLWRAVKNTDGTYTFISKLGNYAIDVAGGKTANGTNIQLYTSNGSKSQKFYLVKDNFLTGTKIIANGTYVVSISKNKKQVLDIKSGSKANKANVQLYKSNNSAAQKFKITYVKDGYYKIINAKSNKAFDVKSASQANGANIWQYTYNGSAAQLWVIKKNSNGTYTFVSRCNGKVVDAKGGKTANGTNIQVYKSNGSAAQKYYLTKK